MAEFCTDSKDGRSLDQLRRHYHVEKEIADRLRKATREQRIEIMRTMYDELFTRVPDHPRLTVSRDKYRSKIAVARKLKLIQPHLTPDCTFLEFGPGNCDLAAAVCQRVRHVYAVDIADNMDPSIKRPANLNLVVYDGFQLDIPDESIDVVFSDQMLEHLHPDDAAEHLRLVHRLLTRGGVYILRTPQRLFGPHDISKYFSTTPEGFHLKEWTFRDVGELSQEVGFSAWSGFWFARGVRLMLPRWLLLPTERMISLWPVTLRHLIGPYLLPSVTVALSK